MLEIQSSIERSVKFKTKKFKFTKKQQQLLVILLDPETKVVFISGPAGSAKTYMSLYAMLQIIKADFDKDILYIRSIAESADKGLGSLPGDIEEKFDPFLMPLYDKIGEIIHEGDALFLKQSGKVSAAPVNYLRGASWEDKLVFADEAQNFTMKELTTLITRIGERTKVIIGGDFMQSDINGRSGFKNMVDKFDDQESIDNGIHVFQFTKDDIVRSEILKFIIGRLENN